jgi:deoxyribodipyrimidine photo-lyase
MHDMKYLLASEDVKSLRSVQWQPSRSAGLKRLSDFLPFTAEHYTKERNFDLGALNRSNISALSPWIKHRLIQETEVLTEVGKLHSFRSSEKFVQEVFWRGYFKGWLEHNPKVWTRFKSDISRLEIELATDPSLSTKLEIALSGKTGIECFDSWVNELQTTGYLQNHTRMWFASIWIFTLKLPWQLGAKFFYQNLLDGDIASNTLSWRWVAGLHTKGKTYLARPSNIDKFTNGRFNPEGQLSDEAMPLTEADLPAINVVEEHPMSFTLAQGKKFGLLLTPEDCRPETINLPSAPQAILCCNQASQIKPLQQTPMVQTFKTTALENSMQRAQDHYQCSTQLHRANDWINHAVQWAKTNDFDYVVTPFASVGPLADQIKELRIILEDSNIHLHEIARPYDNLVWPHAQKGFFKLKAQIPNLLASLNISMV